MTQDLHKNNHNYLLHNGKSRVTIFNFAEHAPLPHCVIKIGGKPRIPRVEQMRELFDKINRQDSPLLKDSLPRVLRCELTQTGYVIEEEYAEGISMELRAQVKSFFWKALFFQDLSVSTAWIGDFHKRFMGKTVVIPQDTVSLVCKKIGLFLKCGFLGINPSDIEIPTVVSHGDFRPANILRTARGIVVVDWEEFKTEGLPLFDLLEFILRYMHAHYKLQREKIYLEQKNFLKYFDLFYLQNNSIAKAVRQHCNAYVRSIGLHDTQKNILLALWLYRTLYYDEKDSLDILKYS